MVVGDNEIDDNKKYTSNAGHFDDHAEENIQGFTGSHWMPPSDECLCTALPRRPPWSTDLLKQH
jgi:hypothetical protein